MLKNAIKLSFLLSLIAFVAVGLQAQDDKSQRKSPPMETTGMVGDVEVKINYSAPSVKGRTIFGDLEPWDEVWRTGANEATTFEVSKNVLIEGEELAAGTYALFTIPGQERWTIIFNSVADQWGDYDYDESKDVLRVEVTPKTTEEVTEQMKIALKEKEGTSHIMIKWDHTKVPFTIAPAASN